MVPGTSLLLQLWKLNSALTSCVLLSSCMLLLYGHTRIHRGWAHCPLPCQGAGSCGEHLHACAPSQGPVLALVLPWCALPFCRPPLSRLGVAVPQLLPANEWRSNYCYPISGPRRWVSLVTGLSVTPSPLLCFYQQCNAEELVPVWGRGEGGWHGRARVWSGELSPGN